MQWYNMQLYIYAGIGADVMGIIELAVYFRRLA